MPNTNIIAALRAVLPLAEDRADEYRARAAEALQRWPDGQGAEYAAQLASDAETATAAVTGAKLALADFEKESCAPTLIETLRALHAATRPLQSPEGPLYPKAWYQAGKMLETVKKAGNK